MNAENQPQPQPVTIWMDPVHPNCRVFDGRGIHAYSQKLAKAGETVALMQLNAALRTATYRPTDLRRWPN